MNNYAVFNYNDLTIIFSQTELNNFTNIDVNNWKSVGVSTDSRTLKAGNIFVALEGKQYNGHSFTFEAISQSASVVIIADKWFSKNKSFLKNIQIPFIIVKDTKKALTKLAEYHRNRFDCKIIAVGGSNGKTTTKELISYLLSTKYNVLKTEKNFNNYIGVAHTLLQLTDKFDVLVVEIGTSQPGEIFELIEIIRPTDGIITNIGLEHLEQLIDLDGVEIEETMLFGNLMKTGGRCFINIDDDRLKKYKDLIYNSISYGLDKSANYRVEVNFDKDLHPILFLYNIEVAKDKFELAPMQTIGLAYALNAIAASAVSYGFGLSNKDISKGLINYIPDNDQNSARMVLEKIGHWYILNDCYNANPSSMELSLQTLHMYPNADYKIAILGDMFELGQHSIQEHYNTIKYALELTDEVFVVGTNMRTAGFEIISKNIRAKLRIFKNFYEIVTYLIDFDVDMYGTIALLIKGSRGMEMELLIKMIKDKCCIITK